MANLIRLPSKFSTEFSRLNGHSPLHAINRFLPAARFARSLQASPSTTPSSTLALAPLQQLLFEGFIPAAAAALIEEPAAKQLLASVRRVPVQMTDLGTVETAVVGPTAEQLERYPANAPAVVLLHGFDSSMMEYRRLLPLLATSVPTYAIDLIGWGFTDSSRFASDAALTVGPEAKRAHLAAWIQQHLGERPVVLLGSSLGGAAVLDFAQNFPKAVSKLVLMDAQCYIDGIGPAAALPRWAAALGVQVLRTEWLRGSANQMSYFDKPTMATNDAVRIGRLHTFMPGWQQAIMSFISSGGYTGIGARVPEVQAPTLVLWGREDGILPPADATRLSEELPNGQLVWIEQCGHVPHLEQPQQVARLVLDFIGASREITA